MSTEVVVVMVAALPPTLAAVLAFLSSRAVKRSIATQGDAPIGPLVERLQRQVDHLGGTVAEIASRLATLEGREILPLQLDRRVEKLDEDLRDVRERLARIIEGSMRPGARMLLGSPSLGPVIGPVGAPTMTGAPATRCRCRCRR